MDFVTRSNDPVIAFPADVLFSVYDVGVNKTIFIDSNPIGSLSQACVNAWNSKVRVGDVISINTGNNIVGYTEYEVQFMAVLDTGRMQILVSTTCGQSPTPIPMAPFNVYRHKPSRRVKQFEIIWRPNNVFEYF